MPTDYSQADPQVQGRQRTDYGQPDKPAAPKDKPYVRRAKESYHQLKSDLPFGFDVEDVVHPDPGRIAAKAARAVTSTTRAALQPGAAQSISPSNVAARLGGDVPAYLTDAPVGGTIEHLTPDVQLPAFLKNALSLIPGGKEWASDPRSVARLAGDVGATLVAPPSERLERFTAGLVPKLEGEEAATAREGIGALERLGAKPSTAMLVPRARGLGILAGQNPFIGGPIRKRIHEAEEAVQRKAESFRQGTPERAGERVKEGLTRFQRSGAAASEALEGDRSGFRAPGEHVEGTTSETTRKATITSFRRAPAREVGFGPKATVLYNDAYEKIGPLTHPIIASRTQATLAKISRAFDNKAFSQFFDEETTSGIREILKAAGGQISFEDLRRLRTSYRMAMRKALEDPAVRADINEADVRRVYDAMSEDLLNGAEMLGKLWRGEEAGKAARKAWWQADTFYRGGIDRIDDSLSRFYGKGTTPAEVFYRLLNAGRGGAKQDLTALMAVRRSLPPEDWQAFASTVIDQAGRSAPGQATSEAEFSLNTFLTNYNKLVEPAAEKSDIWDSGFKVLFEGNFGKGVAADAMRDMATVASHYRELMRGKNISYTAGHIAFGLVPATATVMAHNPLLSVLTIGTGRYVSSLLSNPKFIKWLARVPKDGSPGDTARYTRQMKAWLATVGAGTSIGRQRLDQAQNPSNSTGEQ